MSLSVGARLGPYEVTSLLGAGGMGEVYRARDTKLDRHVALKVLPELFAADRERLARFEREARTLASLNYPHIAQVHGFEEVDGVRALVMELVEGEDLAQRLARGPLAIDEALPMARQIAEAIEYAHEHGVIHRDLKPANIKLTADGTVKVLDFGLAKALDAGGSSSADAMNSPTITSPVAMTRAGVILGTAAYMAPEQARGKAVDKRADIWAFGCVLFEMLTAARPFEGETVTDTLAAALRGEPDWAKLPADLPTTIPKLLRRCLEKDPKQRLHDIADARLEIQEALSAPAQDVGATSYASGAHGRTAKPSSRERLSWAVAALALIAAAFFAFRSARQPEPNTRALRLSLVHPAGGRAEMPAISPDGRSVVYVAPDPNGTPVLWVRDLDASAPRPLAGTENAADPFWSPDSRSIGFIAAPQLKRVPASGGPVKIVGDLGLSRGATWAPDDTIVFATSDAADGLARIPAAGGKPEFVTICPTPTWGHTQPTFLPDGRRFLFLARDWSRSAETSDGGVYLGSLDSHEIRRLLPDHSNAIYVSPGYLVFQRAGQLMAAPFDATTATLLAGDVVPLGEPVDVDGQTLTVPLSAAAGGTLAIGTPNSFALKRQLRWVDRRGATVATLGEPDYFSAQLAVSADGSRVAVQVADPRTTNTDVWLLDAGTGRKTRFTSAPEWEGRPIWFPDGSQIIYATTATGMDDILIRDLEGGAAKPLVLSERAMEQPTSVSRDGRYLLVRVLKSSSTVSADRNWDLFVWSFAERKLTPYLASPASEMWGVFAPDGRHVAYTSNETGRDEVWVATFPTPTQKWQVTRDGAAIISWRADSREILAGTMSGELAAIPVTVDAGFRAGAPAILVRGLGLEARYAAAAPDHSRFLVKTSPDAGGSASEIRLLFGWDRSLRRTR